ncbi:MAG: hypothetical protein JWN40_878 [Phycisphaerales bacterium]|nr:hypothetical protein [Phycisphaerales bacterium]
MNTVSQKVPECPKFDDANANAEPKPDRTDPPLPANQQAAIALLLTGAHTGDVAAACGIDRRTLYRWRHQDPNFIRELRRQRAQLLDNVNDRFRYLLNNALSALELQVADPYAPTSHRAAKTLLALARIGQPTTPRPRASNQSAIRNPQSAIGSAPILPTPTTPDYTPAQT